MNKFLIFFFQNFFKVLQINFYHLIRVERRWGRTGFWGFVGLIM